MNIVKIKGLVASNRITNGIAEGMLEIYTVIRRKVTGSYTKNKEDVIALNLLRQYLNKPVNEIKYLDIGANHFRRGNNSYLFYEYGARGILVEADPLLCKKLKKHREEDRIINAAIGDGNESIPFYILSLPTRSSMDKEHVKRSLKEGFSVRRILKIPCKNLEDLLNEYDFEPDYLSIDIEGMDYTALRTLKYEKHRIKVIIAEKTAELKEGESMDAYMERQGYEEIGRASCRERVLSGV